MFADDPEGYENVEYEDQGPPKPTFGWRVLAATDAAIASGTEVVTFVGEQIERAFYFTLSLLTLVFMPWRWFRREPESLEESELAAPDTGVSERIEGVFYAALNTLTFALMPWRWFRREPEALEEIGKLDEGNRGVSEQIEGVFYSVLSLLTFLLMPWRWFRREPETLEEVDGLNGDSKIGPINQIRYRVLGLFDVATGILHEAFDFVWDLFAELLPKYFPRQIFWPIYWGLDAVLAVYDFWMEWWYSRDFRQVLFALPAVLLGMGLGSASLAGFFLNETGKIRHYEERLTEAKEASGQTATTALLEQKLEQLGFENLEEVQFRAAMEHVVKGDYDTATDMMRQIAPLDRPGFAMAHLWLANGLINGIIEQEDETKNMESFETHVDHAATLVPEHPLTKRFQLESRVRRGLMDEETFELMVELANTQRDLHASLAHEYVARGEMAAARRSARIAIRDFEEAIEYGASSYSNGRESIAASHYDHLTPVGYLRMSECYKLVDNVDGELRLLSRAVGEYQDEATLSTALLARSVELFKSLPLTDERAFDLAQTVLQRDGGNKPVILRIVEGLSAESLPRPPANANLIVEKADELAVRLEEAGLLPSNVYVYAGDFHLIREKHSKAIEFYARACKMDPNAGFAWNNLASIWSTVKPYQLKKALNAANRAIQLNPDPRFYDTRGQIFVKLNRWEDAIRDLEFAVGGSIPNLEDAHRSLAASYEAIGKSEQAQAHKDILANLQ